MFLVAVSRVWCAKLGHKFLVTSFWYQKLGSCAIRLTAIKTFLFQNSLLSLRPDPLSEYRNCPLLKATRRAELLLFRNCPLSSSFLSPKLYRLFPSIYLPFLGPYHQVKGLDSA